MLLLANLRNDLDFIKQLISIFFSRDYCNVVYLWVRHFGTFSNKDSKCIIEGRNMSWPWLTGSLTVGTLGDSYYRKCTWANLRVSQKNKSNFIFEAIELETPIYIFNVQKMKELNQKVCGRIFLSFSWDKIALIFYGNCLWTSNIIWLHIIN